MPVNCTELYCDRAGEEWEEIEGIKECPAVLFKRKRNVSAFGHKSPLMLVFGEGWLVHRGCCRSFQARGVDLEYLWAKDMFIWAVAE